MTTVSGMAAEDRTTAPRRGLRRVLAAAGVLMAIAAVVVLVAGTGGGPDGGTLPEAGSRFRDETGAARNVGDAESRGELARDVAQLFVVGFQNERPPTRRWGGVVVSDANFVSPTQLRALTRRIARAALREGDPVPLVLGDPALLGELGPRDPADLGLDGTPAQARASARAAAARLRGAGVRMVLAPPADLGFGGGPAELRAFGDDPAAVADYVSASVAGWRDGSVLPAPGRFPGEGAASQDPLEGPASVGSSLDELMGRDVLPFAAVVDTAPAIQMSAALYAAWDGVTPATLLPDAVRLLRERLRFRGAIVSADLVAAQAATGEGIGRGAIEAFMAGCDLLLISGGRAEQEAAYRALLTAAQRGRIPRSRIEDSAARVARLRTAAG
jgi:beta-N-acetylhexosaminidase